MANSIDPSKIGQKGGNARAKSLSPEQRSEIARKAAAARWGGGTEGGLPGVICGGDDPLRFGDDVEVPCYVLDDERRVITKGGIKKALGMSANVGEARMVQYVAEIDPNPSSVNEFAVRMHSPVLFQKKRGGKPIHGFEAKVLADACESILDAHQAGMLRSDTQERMARQVNILSVGWARAGIEALVDEVTGFEKFNKKLALAAILDKHLQSNLDGWAKTFPDEYYEHFFRLLGFDYENLEESDIEPGEIVNRIRDVVYRHLQPSVVEDLEKEGPCAGAGPFKHKYHAWLSQEIGHAKLEKHLAQIVIVMKLSTDWLQFEGNLEIALGRV